MTAAPVTTELTLLRVRASRLASGTGTLQDVGWLTEGLRGLAARLRAPAAGTAAELEDFAARLDHGRARGVLGIADLQALAGRLAALAAEGTGA
ncbi:MAG TPA: hypothetical protein VGM53_35445 [Streptosporangiaceae bacterium]